VRVRFCEYEQYTSYNHCLRVINQGKVLTLGTSENNEEEMICVVKWSWLAYANESEITFLFSAIEMKVEEGINDIGQLINLLMHGIYINTNGLVIRLF
jgi:hypothetical protein